MDDDIEQAYRHWNHPDHIHEPCLPSNLPLLFEPRLPICIMKIATEVWWGVNELAYIKCLAQSLDTVLALYTSWLETLAILPAIKKKLKQQRHFKSILLWQDHHYHKWLLYALPHSPWPEKCSPILVKPTCPSLSGDHSNDDNLDANSQR